MVVSNPPMLRVRGDLQALDGAAVLTAGDINQAFEQITTAGEREEFREHLELDFGYTLAGVGRLRCNAAQQQGTISLAVRILPQQIPTVDELELPQICKELVVKPRGLIVVTGPTGSGKSTTLAAMLRHLNRLKNRRWSPLKTLLNMFTASISAP